VVVFLWGVLMGGGQGRGGRFGFSWGDFLGLWLGVKG